MSRAGVNKDYLKKRNRGLVLQHIATERCVSRVELARETGLTKTAISAIVNKLLEKGYLTEAEKEKGRHFNKMTQIKENSVSMEDAAALRAIIKQKEIDLASVTAEVVFCCFNSTPWFHLRSRCK